jgi:Tol biopolymer transport system component
MIKRRAGSTWWVSIRGVSLLVPWALGCTLLDNSFDPARVAQTDAGSGANAEADAAAEVDLAPGLSSCPSGSAPSTGDVDPSCMMSIGLVLSEDAGLGADAVAPQGTLSLPPCSGAFGPFAAPEPLTGLDFDENVFGPALSADGRTLYFSGYVAGQQQIYSATRIERGVAFSGVLALSSINSPGADGSPFVTRDGQHLYFFSDRNGGAGSRDIWVSERGSLAQDFASPALVRALNSNSGELLPWLSPDELTVLFVSSRGGGRGGADLWRATRPSSGAEFGTPVDLFELSSDQNEGRVVLSSDGNAAFFTSDRAGGGSDIWTASRQQNTGAFSGLRRLDQLNSADAEVDVMLSSDDTEIFFASARGGVSQLWRAVRTCS